MAKKGQEISTGDDFEDIKTSLEGKEILSTTEFLSTGSTLLDYAIANRKNGGVPVGRITEIFGNEACVTEDTEIEVIIED
jgi:RecA/RadA recombinase